MTDPWSIQRSDPYTKDGIKRKRCIRCGGEAEFQWTICADGNNFRPICKTCDILLNELVLVFMRHPKAVELIQEYERSMR